MNLLEMLNVKIFTLATVIITPPFVDVWIFVSFSQPLTSKLDRKDKLAFLDHSSLLRRKSVVDKANHLSCKVLLVPTQQVYF